jgi:phage terminase small subunit
VALTAKQQAFIAAYAGNATQAARDAGYTGSDETLRQMGAQNMAHPEIAAAIKARETKREGKAIATREERQAFWTAVFLDETQNMLVRLKASELLGKSEADFVERHEHKGNISIIVGDPYTGGDK